MSADLAEGPEEKAEEVTPERLVLGDGSSHGGNGANAATDTNSSSSSGNGSSS
jgi:hypothetical protein